MATSDPKKTDKPKTVFVIAPIDKLDESGVDFAKLCLEQIIKPAASICGGYAVPVRADDQHKPGSVTGKIVKSILDSDVCVADLTGRNPNVMYEVAIAHAAGKPVILLQQEAGGPPFDFADERVIHYGLRIDLANDARDELVGHFKAAHEDEEDELLAKTMNPVRQLFAELMTSAKASDPQKAMLAELQALRSEVREVSRDIGVHRDHLDLTGSSSQAFPDTALIQLVRRLEREDRLSTDVARIVSERIPELDSKQQATLHSILSKLDQATPSPQVRRDIESTILSSRPE